MFLKFKYFFPYVLFASFVFLGANVLSFLGIRLLQLRAIMIICSFVYLFVTRVYIKNDFLLRFVLFGLFYFLYLVIFDRGAGIYYYSISFIGAPLLFACFQHISIQTDYGVLCYKKIFYVFLISYFFETGIAIYEGITKTVVFGYHGAFVDWGDLSGGFRSPALYGHFLNNALMVSVAMTFILLSPLKAKIKFFLWGIGFFAIMCFNTRSSIVGNFLLLILYFLSTFLSGKRLMFSTKIKIFSLILIITIFAFWALFYGGYGDRLMDRGLYGDDSSQVRVDVWKIFDRLELKYFLYGHTIQEMDVQLSRIGVVAVENYWLCYLFRLGFVFLIPYAFLLVLVILSLFRNYSLQNKFFIIVFFFLLSSTNNSLAADFGALFYFFILSLLFDPTRFGLVVDKKFFEQQP